MDCHRGASWRRGHTVLARISLLGSFQRWIFIRRRMVANDVARYSESCGDTAFAGELSQLACLGTGRSCVRMGRDTAVQASASPRAHVRIQPSFAATGEANTGSNCVSPSANVRCGSQSRHSICPHQRLCRVCRPHWSLVIDPVGSAVQLICEWLSGHAAAIQSCPSGQAIWKDPQIKRSNQISSARRQSPSLSVGPDSSTQICDGKATA